MRQSALVVPDKAERVRQFHDGTVSALADMLAAAGVAHPNDLKPHHLVHRETSTELHQFGRQHHFIAPGTLVSGECVLPFYADNWALAQAASFAPAAPPQDLVGPTTPAKRAETLQATA